MKTTILFSFLIFSISFLLWSCSSNPTSVDGGTPIEPDTPKNAKFSYLMFENDFNGVPQDGNPAEYTTKFRPSEGSGMSFEITNERQFAPGVSAVLDKTSKGDIYKISFNCFKEAAPDPANVKGFVVVSLERGDSAYHYKAYPINDLLKAQNKNLISKWTNLTVWHPSPEGVQPKDLLKIYVWNPEGGSMFIDDFIVETWTTEALVPTGVALSHGLLEQNYETPDVANMVTNETAARGMASCVLSASGVQFGAGYTGTLEEAQIKPGDYIKISFAALKKDKMYIYNSAASMVVSLERGGSQIFWTGNAIEPQLFKAGKQVLNEWVTLEVWKQIPADAQPKDLLKIYPWNALPNPIFIDDVRVEVWRATN